MTPPQTPMFGWLQIVRLGLVQAALGAIVVLTTSTLNRVMVVELALPALLPGALVGLHYLVQLARPRVGYGGDVGGRRTPWIVGGIGALGLGAIGASLSTLWLNSLPLAGIALAVLSFVLIGLGVASSGTSLLVLLAQRVAPQHRAAAATVVWLMMIAGFAISAGAAGSLLDPYSPARLLAVTGTVAVVAFGITCFALRGVEGPARVAAPAQAVAEAPGFRAALAQVWSEALARRFTIFVFVSMLAFSAQDLILEPFAGTVFGFTPGESTRLSGVQHGGVLSGMLLAAFAGSRWRGRRFSSIGGWTVGGCLASALALAGLVAAGAIGLAWPLKLNVFLLGAANGAFSIAAIGSMMRLAGEGRETREGVRMGLWGSAQALGFALGGLAGTAASDLARGLIGDPGTAYAAVFAVEALLFVVAARLAIGTVAPAGTRAAVLRPLKVVAASTTGNRA